MYRKILILIFLVTVLYFLNSCFINNTFTKGFSIAQYTKTHGPALEKIKSATVYFRNKNRRWSGIAISPDGKVLTACHGVVGSKNMPYIKYDKSIEKYEIALRGRYGDKEFEHVKVVSVFPELDLAIVDIGLPTESYLTGSTTGPKEEDLVFLTGISTHNAQISSGKYFACSDASGWKKAASIWVDGPAFKGDSGGAIVNEKGELLGIMTNNVDPKELLALIKTQKEVFAGRNYIIIATAVPPQVITAVLNSKTRLNFSATKGNVEKDWGAISLTEPTDSKL